MKNIYEREIQVAKALDSDAERIAYLSAVLRSMMQTLAIVSLEAVRDLTPYLANDPIITPLLLRFSQPSEGLYGEVLDATVPIIRSYVTKSFMAGWFEKTPPTNESFSRELVAWVEFRNKKPAHGVLSRQDGQLWCPKLLDLAERCLKLFGPTLPVQQGRELKASLGDVELSISTPLVVDGKALVISSVGARKGIWKLWAQVLNIDVANDVTLDLEQDTVFEVSADATRSRFDLRDLQIGDAKSSLFHNIPIRQTNTFEGRTKELDSLKDWMNDDDSRFCLIYGDGGFGKTTLTLEYLNRLIEGDVDLSTDMPSLISYYTAKMTRWTSDGLVHFKGVSDAMEDCVRELLFCLYPVVGKEWYKASGSALIDKVAGELAEQGFTRNDVLLVLDNSETLATSPEEVEELAEFLKKAGKKIGRILVTSRRREFLPATPIQVSGLSDEEALRLMRRLAREYSAVAINQAGDAKLRQVCAQLTKKPLLIDTLVKYIARSGTGIEAALEHVLRRTSDQLLEFLYEDAWMRMNDLRRKIFLILVSMVSPIDGRCIGDACQVVGLQHVEFQAGLDETYFATVTDRGATYDLDVVDLAKQFFRKQIRKLTAQEQDEVKRLAEKIDKQAVRRAELDRAYVRDRVADAFRSQFAKAAKLAVDRRDFAGADENFKLAMLEEPMNAALKDRYAWFVANILQSVQDALPFAREAAHLDPKSGDAHLTLGLIQYRLGFIEHGDASIENAMLNGKPHSLCFLRMAIARYYQARRAPYSREALRLLKEADILLQQSEKAGDSNDFYFYKNLHDIRRYGSMVSTLRARINRRDVFSKDSPAPEGVSRGASGPINGLDFDRPSS